MSERTHPNAFQLFAQRDLSSSSHRAGTLPTIEEIGTKVRDLAANPLRYTVDEIVSLGLTVYYWAIGARLSGLSTSVEMLRSALTASRDEAAFKGNASELISRVWDLEDHVSRFYCSGGV